MPAGWHCRRPRDWFQSGNDRRFGGARSPGQSFPPSITADSTLSGTWAYTYRALSSLITRERDIAMVHVSPYLPGILLVYAACFLGLMSPGPNILSVIGTSMG